MSFRSFLKSSSFWKHFTLSLVVVALVIWGAITLMKVYTLHGEHVVVSDFKGYYPKDLDKFVEDHDLKYEIVDSVFNRKLPKGTVIDQDPAPGATVKNGRTIYLTLNASLNQKVTMPNLINLSLRQATSKLETYGLKVGNLRYIEGLPPVIQQLYNGKEIKAGTIIIKDSEIDLVLGRGSNTGLIPVPDLFGMTITEARVILEGRKLRFGNRLPDASGSDTLIARIYMQNPPRKKSEGLYAGAEIDVWLTGKEEILEAERLKNDSIE